MSALRVMSYNVGGLRGDLAAMAAVVREQRPDVVAVQEAPRRLRWRARCADLARRFGLFYAEGGSPGLGNLLLVDLRVRLQESWCLRYPLVPGRRMHGAALARCSVAGSTFVVAGTYLATDPAERLGQAEILVKALAERDEPVLVGAHLNEGPDGAAWATLAESRTDAGPDAPTSPAAQPRRRIDAILVDRRIRVADRRVVDTPDARRASDHLPVVADLVLPVDLG